MSPNLGSHLHAHTQIKPRGSRDPRSPSVLSHSNILQKHHAASSMHSSHEKSTRFCDTRRVEDGQGSGQQKATFGRRCFPLHHNSIAIVVFTLITHHRPSVRRRSPFAVRRSPFVADRRSSFVVRCAVRCSFVRWFVGSLVRSLVSTVVRPR